MTAFEYAWSVLKALPEQQAFEQDFYPPKQFSQEGEVTGSTIRAPTDVFQRKIGTVPPPIMGAMRRLQEEDVPDRLRMEVNDNARIMGQLTHAPRPPRAFQSGGGDLASEFNSRMRRRTRSHPERKPVNRIDQSIAGPHEPLDADAIYAYLQSIGY